MLRGYKTASYSDLKPCSYMCYVLHDVHGNLAAHRAVSGLTAPALLTVSDHGVDSFRETAQNDFADETEV